MNTLPIVFLTKDRTCCAVNAVEAMLSHLKCTGYAPRYIICDDASVPGHLDAVLKEFAKHGVSPEVHVSTADRHGLGAIMNMGLDAAFSDPSVNLCLRMEDDWILSRDVDLGPWLDSMDSLHIGSLRLGMMFRDRCELLPFPEDPKRGECPLWKVASMKRQLFTFNNQVAVVSREMYDMVGKYPENDRPAAVEKHGANIYNRVTGYGANPPYVAWPSSWTTRTHYGDNLPFVHVGISISGHTGLYPIPQKYRWYNDPSRSEELRRLALQ